MTQTLFSDIKKAAVLNLTIYYNNHAFSQAIYFISIVEEEEKKRS
jgi:hypothetical protein